MKHIVLVLLLFMISACSESKETDPPGEPESPPAYNTPIQVSEMKVTSTGRKYLDVNGKPLLMLGAQLRTDYFLQLENKTLDQLAPYFELAKKLNITVIQVPISWRDVEPEKDKYTSKMVDKYIEYCNRYDLKLEILWFGSYMCGYSVRGYIPDYVVNNTHTYPELNPAAGFNGWLGKHYFLTPNTDALVDRESKALEYMMDAVWEYDRRHEGKRTVVGIQVENEPDMLATRHNEAHGFQPEDLWGDLISMLDKLGQVVKNSKYKCYTRVNLTTTYPDYMERSAAIVATQGIDFVGLDPYENSVEQIGKKLEGLDAINGNFAHIAENGGEYTNNDILTLKAFTQGAGYEVFEVVTTSHPYLADWTLRGVFNTDFSPKAHTQRIIDAFKIFKDAKEDFAVADTGNILGFNLKDDDGLQVASETQSTANVTVEWETTSHGIAFAIENNNFLTIGSTKNDVMTFSGKGIAKVEKGKYDTEGNWKPEGSVNLENNSMTLESCQVYRMELAK